MQVQYSCASTFIKLAQINSPNLLFTIKIMCSLAHTSCLLNQNEINKSNKTLNKNKRLPIDFNI